MSEASFASLGPTLLARKGGAKPAMRPQLAPLPGVVPPEADQLEDLGWNDMGLEAGSDSPAVHLGPPAQNPVHNVSIHPTALSEPHNDDTAVESPLVHRQQKRLAERILADSGARKTRSPVAKKTKAARRAAFTLRLDSERHLKLRLAATLNGVSAQAFVTEALDAMLSEIEELDGLAERFSGARKHN